MLRGPGWRRLLPDVYVHADVFDPDDHRMWCKAVGITLGKGSAVDRYSAAFLWGVDLLGSRRIVSVTVPRGERPRSHPWRRVTRTALADVDIECLDGVPVTTPRRTAFDLGRQPSRQATVIALDAMCHVNLARPADLAEDAERHRRKRGARRLGERLSLVEPLTESPMETVLRLLVRDAGLPPPAAQVTVRRDGRFVARVDLGYRQWRIAIEYEGDHHRGRQHFRRDVARLNALREAGWVVLRFTADDVLRRPRDVIRQVAEAVREAAARS
jgi:very-short-patch-repair endonuclease